MGISNPIYRSYISTPTPCVCLSFYVEGRSFPVPVRLSGFFESYSRPFCRIRSLLPIETALQAPVFEASLDPKICLTTIISNGQPLGSLRGNSRLHRHDPAPARPFHEETGAFMTQIEEVDRAIDNLAKSGKMFP